VDGVACVALPPAADDGRDVLRAEGLRGELAEECRELFRDVCGRIVFAAAFDEERREAAEAFGARAFFAALAALIEA